MSIVGYSIGDPKKIECGNMAYSMFDVELVSSEKGVQKKTFFTDYPNDGISVDLATQSEDLRRSVFVDNIFNQENQEKAKIDNSDYFYLGKVTLGTDGVFSIDKTANINTEETAEEYFYRNIDYIKEQAESLKKDEQAQNSKYQNKSKEINVVKKSSNDIRKCNETKTVAASPNKPTNKVKTIKHSYAISDIHGMYGAYEKCLKQLNNNDDLYILGDVLDGKNQGMKILLDIVQRKNKSNNNPNITLVSGDNEWVFYRNIKVINEIKSKYENKANKKLNFENLMSNVDNFLKFGLEYSEIK